MLQGQDQVHMGWAVGVALASLLSSLEMDKRADRSSLGSCLEEVGSGRKDGGPLLPSSLLGFIWVREVGGGFRMGDTYTPIADSCQCMAKTTCLRKGTPLASRVVLGVSGPLSNCVWNLQVFPDDAWLCQ